MKPALTLAAELETELLAKLDIWYPRVVDEEYGGFLTDFTHDWRLTEPQNKMIVTQSRHLWTLAKAGRAYTDRAEYVDYTANGYRFLRNQMWDHAFGGFYQTVSRTGEPVPDERGALGKTLYGNAFAIYGLAAYHAFSGDPGALELAREAFLWLEDNAHDPKGKGYFQPLARDGTPFTGGESKDYNSSIHILEALIELYVVLPDPLVHERLNEMFHIVRDIITTDTGYLRLYFDADWTHLSYRDTTESVIRENMEHDHVSPGHDIETAFLLLEAAHTLGMTDDPATHRIAKAMTDHTLENGWDSDAGGVYDAGYYFAGDHHLTILRDTKAWWAQAEALHTLAIMAREYPDDPHDYFQKLGQQWEYIKANLIDHDHGGWYDSGLDKNPESRTARKSQVWKGNYHTVRSLLGGVERLRQGAERGRTVSEGHL